MCQLGFCSSISSFGSSNTRFSGFFQLEFSRIWVLRVKTRRVFEFQVALSVTNTYTIGFTGSRAYVHRFITKACLIFFQVWRYGAKYEFRKNYWRCMLPFWSIGHSPSRPCYCVEFLTHLSPKPKSGQKKSSKGEKKS